MKPSLLLREIALLSAGLGFAALAQAGPYTNLYVFGDSLSDIGNDYVITGGAVPAPAYYSSGSIVGRFSNGLGYADHLAAGLGLNLAPSVQGGTAYAYGGARMNGVAAKLPASAKSFTQQLLAYGTAHPTADANALYVLWIGANDLSDGIRAQAFGTPDAVEAAITMTLQGLGGAIQDLASRGATHFLIPNLPDLSLTPRIRAMGSDDLSSLAQLASTDYNNALDDMLDGFAALDIRSFDVFAAQTEITNNPGAFGFTNVTSACYTGDVDGQAVPGGPAPSICANANEYLYLDDQHPTATLHAELGARALAAAVPEPAQWLQLSFGLAALAWLGRNRRQQQRQRAR